VESEIRSDVGSDRANKNDGGGESESGDVFCEANKSGSEIFFKR
jgi:hypothetical protein